jgi:hypothetical protein
MEVTLIVQSIDQADLIIEHFEVMVFKIVLFIIGMHDLYKYAQRFFRQSEKGSQ